MIMTRRVVRGRWSVVGRVATGSRPGPWPRPRSGITLTEILIAIMILGVGLVSLATLFPIGLLRLRDANRWSRSATLLQTAASDAISRGLFGSQSFSIADHYNYNIATATNGTVSLWYFDSINGVPFNPLIQDTSAYGGATFTVQNGVTTYVGANTNPFIQAEQGVNGGP